MSKDNKILKMMIKNYILNRLPVPDHIKQLQNKRSTGNFKIKHRGLRKYFSTLFQKHSHKQEKARRKRQIKRGMLNVSNGLI